MKLYTRLLLICGLILNFSNSLRADDNFYEEGKKKYIEKNYDESKFFSMYFLIQRIQIHIYI
jgi:hypothetical protein